MAGAAAAYADIFVLQDQVNTTNLTEFDYLFNTTRNQALAANPQVQEGTGATAGVRAGRYGRGFPVRVASAPLDGYGDGVALRGRLCLVATGHHSSAAGY